MEVILKEDVDKVGHAGDVVKVADGYGRNFLLPRKLAIEATKANKTIVEHVKQAALKRVAREKTTAEAQAKQLDTLTLTFERKAGEKDVLFGSVTSADIVAELAKKGYELDRRKIHLDDSLKTIGEFLIPIKLYRDVTAHVRVVIAKEGE